MGRPSTLPRQTRSSRLLPSRGSHSRRTLAAWARASAGRAAAWCAERDPAEVKTELACETLVEEGMQVSFIDYFTPRRPHVYQIEDVQDSWCVNAQLNEIFPEAKHCRHCGGCDRSCPKDIEVQLGVNLAAAGDIRGASDVFETCVMCNLCTLACPEYIRPNHVGTVRAPGRGGARPASQGPHRPLGMRSRAGEWASM